MSDQMQPSSSVRIFAAPLEALLPKELLLELTRLKYDLDAGKTTGSLMEAFLRADSVDTRLLRGAHGDEAAVPTGWTFATAVCLLREASSHPQRETLLPKIKGMLDITSPFFYNGEATTIDAGTIMALMYDFEPEAREQLIHSYLRMTNEPSATDNLKLPDGILDAAFLATAVNQKCLYGTEIACDELDSETLELVRLAASPDYLVSEAPEKAEAYKMLLRKARGTIVERANVKFCEDYDESWDYFVEEHYKDGTWDIAWGRNLGRIAIQQGYPVQQVVKGLEALYGAIYDEVTNNRHREEKIRQMVISTLFPFPDALREVNPTKMELVAPDICDRYSELHPSDHLKLHFRQTYLNDYLDALTRYDGEYFTPYRLIGAAAQPRGFDKLREALASRVGTWKKDFIAWANEGCMGYHFETGASDLVSLYARNPWLLCERPGRMAYNRMVLNSGLNGEGFKGSLLRYEGCDNDLVEILRDIGQLKADVLRSCQVDEAVIKRVTNPFKAVPSSSQELGM